MEGDTMKVVDEIRLDNSKFDDNSYDAPIMLPYAISALTFLVAIYFASMSAGTSLGELATMSVFP
jgi:hypothetical protein